MVDHGLLLRICERRQIPKKQPRTGVIEATGATKVDGHLLLFNGACAQLSLDAPVLIFRHAAGAFTLDSDYVLCHYHAADDVTGRVYKTQYSLDGPSMDASPAHWTFLHRTTTSPMNSGNNSGADDEEWNWIVSTAANQLFRLHLKRNTQHTFTLSPLEYSSSLEPLLLPNILQLFWWDRRGIRSGRNPVSTGSQPQQRQKSFVDTAQSHDPYHRPKLIILGSAYSNSRSVSTLDIFEMDMTSFSTIVINNPSASEPSRQKDIYMDCIGRGDLPVSGNQQWDALKVNPFTNSLQLMAYSKQPSEADTCVATLYIVPLSSTLTATNSFSSTDGFEFILNPHSSSRLQSVPLFQLHLEKDECLEWVKFCSAHLIVWCTRSGRWGIWDLHSTSSGQVYPSYIHPLPAHSSPSIKGYVVRAMGVDRGADEVDEEDADMQMKSRTLRICRYVKVGRGDDAEVELIRESEYLVMEDGKVSENSGYKLTQIEVCDVQQFVQAATIESENVLEVTASLVVEHEWLILGYENGLLRVAPLTMLLTDYNSLLSLNVEHPKVKTLASPTNSRVTSLFDPSYALESNDETTEVIPWVLSGHEDGLVCVWDVKAMCLVRTIHAHPCSVLGMHQADASLYHSLPHGVTSPISVAVPPTNKDRLSKLSLSKRGKPPRMSSTSVDSHSSLSRPLKASSSNTSLVAKHPLLNTILQAVISVGVDGSWAILDVTGGRRVMIFSLNSNFYHSHHIPLQWRSGRIDVLTQPASFGGEDEEGYLDFVLTRNVGRHLCVEEVWSLDADSGYLKSIDLKSLNVSDSVETPATASTMDSEIADWGSPGRKTLVEIGHEMQQETIIQVAKDPLKRNALVSRVDVKRLLTKLSSKSPDAAAIELAKVLLSRFWVWGVDVQMDKIVQDRYAARVDRVSVELCQELNIDLVTLSRHDDSTEVFCRSGDETALRLLWTFSLIKSLGQAELDLRAPGHTLTAFLSVDLGSRVPGFKPPSIDYLAKFYVDMVEDVQMSARILLSGTIKQVTASPSALRSLVIEWTQKLPTKSGVVNKAAVKACVILATLLAREIRETMDMQQERRRILITLPEEGSFTEARDSSAWVGVLSQIVKRELGMSLVMLLSSAHKELVMSRRILAADLLGQGWSVFRVSLVNVTVQDMAKYLFSEEDGSPIAYATVPLNIYVVRKMFGLANVRPLAGGGKDDDLKKAGKVKTSSVIRRRNSTVSGVLEEVDSPSILDMGVADQNERRHVEWRKTYIGAIVPRMRARIVLPSLNLGYFARQALLNMADASPLAYVNTLCSELMLAGLKEGEWDRVKYALRCGVGFIIRHRPIIFYPLHLPRILESIVKGSLDPNIPFVIREKLLPMVTAVLHEVIRVYPTVTFHVGSQKLAVGTAFDATLVQESDSAPQRQPSGQVIIWDLKTASKVQVLEAHSPNNVSAVAFNKQLASTDPKHTHQKHELLLATYSMDDNLVKFWRPGGGLLGALTASFTTTLTMFRSFKVDRMQKPVPQSSSSMTSPGSDGVGVGNKLRIIGNTSGNLILEQVHFEWQSERTVLLKRAEPFASLTFTV